MKKRLKVKAFYNWMSEWIWACPVCNDVPYDGSFVPVADKAAEGHPGICSKCYPEILGAATVEIKPEVFIPGIDNNLKRRAFEMAESKGEVYDIVFPKDKSLIMEILRKRQRVNMNWIPGETLADLERENTEHGVA